VSFDFGEVLTRAWQITWKHKILWAFGILSMLLAYLFMPLGMAPTFSMLMSEDIPVWIDHPAYWLGYFAIFIVLMVLSFLIGALTQAAISVGIVRAEQNEEKLSFGKTLKDSLPYFWRFLGMMGLLTGGVFLVMLILGALYMVITLVTLGLGTICLTPLQFLLYPLMFLVYAWQEQSLAAIVVDEAGVFDAAKRGWTLIRNNLLPVALITLILYIGVGILSGFVSVPLIVPFFAMPIMAIEGFEANSNIILLALLCGAAYLPILAIVQSVALTFMKSGWILTYLRLTRTPDTDGIVSLS